MLLFCLGSLCQEDLDGIQAWNFSLTVDEESLLTEAGRLELENLGERYRKRLPTLFEPTDKVTKRCLGIIPKIYK